MLQRIEMAMHIWTRKPINPSLRTARSIYVIFVNSMPCYNSDRGERTLHSVLQPRGDIYESGVTSTRLRTRLNEAVVRTTDTDIFVILAFQMYAINLSIHLDIGSAKHRRLFTASNVAETLGKENCATLLAFYVFSGDDCTVVPATAGHRWFGAKVAGRGRWPLVTGNGHMRHYVKSSKYIRQHIFCST